LSYWIIFVINSYSWANNLECCRLFQVIYFILFCKDFTVFTVRFCSFVRATQATNTLEGKSMKGGKSWVWSRSQSASNKGVAKYNIVLAILGAISTVDVVFIQSTAKIKELISGEVYLEFRENQVEEPTSTIEYFPFVDSTTHGESKFWKYNRLRKEELQTSKNSWLLNFQFNILRGYFKWKKFHLLPCLIFMAWLVKILIHFSLKLMYFVEIVIIPHMLGSLNCFLPPLRKKLFDSSLGLEEIPYELGMRCNKYFRRNIKIIAQL